MLALCSFICFSAFAALVPLKVRFDQSWDMLDMTLRTLDTDRSESVSACFPFDLGA